MTTTDHPESSLKYHPEVDGLRCIAVVSVILFHATHLCPGGFVGVDVFFVISGYLITSLLLQDHAAGRFTLAQFWERRVRRILPAVLAMNLVTLVAGYWLHLPYNLLQLAKSSAANSFFSSNIFFWRDRDYFNPESELKPLLHTWSLSLEEQFYVGFPILLLLLFRFLDRAWLRHILLFLTVGSFALNVFAIGISPAATFFLLPTRGWELLIGCYLASLQPRSSANRPLSESFSVSGLSAILVSVFCFSSTTPFPGWAAALPVVGTAALIHSNRVQLTFIGRILANPLFVALGKISFGLYLWHWPILAFVRYVVYDDLSWPIIAGVLLATLVLATMSYYLLEQPIRRRQLFATRKSLFIGVGAFWLLSLGLSLGLIATNGAEYRVPFNLRSTPDTHLDRDYSGLATDPLPTFGAKANDAQVPIDFVVWGDSHASMTLPLFDELAQKCSLRGLAAVSPACPPIPNVSDGWNPDLKSWNSAVLNRIESDNIRHVFLIARWATYVEYATRDDQWHGTDPAQSLIYADPSAPRTPANALETLRKSLSELKEKFAAEGRTLHILTQVPEQQDNPRQRLFLESRTFGLYPSPRSGTSRYVHDQRQANVNALFESLASDNFQVIETDAALFDTNNATRWLSDDKLIYMDTNHLTQDGVHFTLQPLLEPILQTIATNR